MAELASTTIYGDLQVTGDIKNLKGIIVMWSGSTSDIPNGWVLCDGAGSTPDLRDRFIVGAGNSYSVGNTGGSNSVTLTESQIPSHDHSMASTGSHGHSASSDDAGYHGHSGWTGSDGFHGHTGSTNTTGDHNHAFQEEAIQWGGSSGLKHYSDEIPYLETRTTDDSGSHSHSLSIDSDGSHTHIIDYGGTHSHSISVSSNSNHSHDIYDTGGDNSHENRPPYYALAFIMKL